MTRKFSALMSLLLGATLLVGTGCEDEAGKAALKTCNTSLESLQKSSSAQTTSMNQLKADLAQAQAKVEALTKENEQLKNPKMGKAETPAAKKPAAPQRRSEQGREPRRRGLVHQDLHWQRHCRDYSHRIHPIFERQLAIHSCGGAWCSVPRQRQEARLMSRARGRWR